MNSINNAIPFVPESTIDPAAGLNEAINVVDVLLQTLVQTVGENTPPAGVEGERHIVGDTPAGLWAGEAGRLARFLDSAWIFYDAHYVLNAEDGLLHVNSAGTWAVYNPSAFVAAPATASDTGTAGQTAWDADYFYVCVATDEWKRVAIASW